MTAPVNDRSVPIMAIWTILESKRTTTRSRLFICAINRLPNTRIMISNATYTPVVRTIRSTTAMSGVRRSVNMAPRLPQLAGSRYSRFGRASCASRPAELYAVGVFPRMNRTRKRRLLWIAGSVVVVLAAVYVAGFIMTGLRMPANASIGAVDVGGLSPGDARKKLSAELKLDIDKPVVLTYDNNKYPVKPEEVGLALDARASVNKAGGGHSWNPADMVGLFFGDQHTDVVNTV